MSRGLERGLQSMLAGDLISADQYTRATDAQDSGSTDHTLGYEIEISRTVTAGNMPLVEEMDANQKPGGGKLWLQCSDAVARYGFGANKDSLYEVTSPVAHHPTALAIATGGIIRTGWLPEVSGAIAPLHPNIGTPHEIRSHGQLHYRAIRMLRVIDLSGGSSPDRMASTIHAYDWNEFGYLGVTSSTGSASRETRTATKWEGSNKRLELRSPEYRDPVQLDRTLQMTHFLTKGLFAAPETPEAEVYATFEDWFADYCLEHTLPDVASMPSQDAKQIEGDSLKAYRGKYADHFESSSRAELIDMAEITVQAIAKLSGQLTTVATQTEQAAAA